MSVHLRAAIAMAAIPALAACGPKYAQVEPSCRPMEPMPVPTPAEPSPVARTFAVVAGGDTIAVERFTRSARALRGELLVPAQGIAQSWAIDVRSDGVATGGTTDVRRLGASAGNGAAPLQSVRVRIAGDTASVTAGGASRAIAVPAGTLPFVNLSAGVIEQIALLARAAGTDTVAVPLLPFGAPQAMPASVRWPAADSAVVLLGGTALHLRLDAHGMLGGAWVPAQRLAFVPVDGGTFDAVAGAAAPDYSAPAGAPYAAEEVSVTNDAGGVTLAGTLTLPYGASASARVPAVIFISGSGPQDRDGAPPTLGDWTPFRTLADTLSRRGIAVLRLDDRGVGASARGPAGATSADLAGDVRAALRFLRTRAEVDTARLALLGHSEGGIIAPMVARDEPALAAVVLAAAQSRRGDAVSDSQVVQTFRERGMPAAAHDSLLAVNAVVRDSMAAGTPWLAWWLAYDPLPAARELRAPTLLVQGATDLQVTADQAAELAAAIRAGGNDDVTVRVFPDVNHLLVRDPSGAFSGYASLPSLSLAPEVVGTIVEWLAERLK